MNTLLEFVKSELASINLTLLKKINGREEVDFLIGNNQIYLQSIDIDTTQRSIKISKQDFGELKDNLFIALILIIDKEPKVVYLIPSKELSQSESNIFINNDVSLMPSLSNWEFKISTNAIPELSKYSLDNMIDKLKE